MGKAKNIQIVNTHSNFEREPMKMPFGFKGGYLSELWQTVVGVTSQNGNNTVGLATQSVLYGDADLFASWSEAGGNALMYALTEQALHIAKTIPFRSPVELMEILLPQLRKEAQRITGKEDINESFILNALVGLDNAAWLLYAAENDQTNFDSMIPSRFQPSLSYRNDKIAIMFQVSYGMALETIEQAVDQGYFIIKIKTGQPGNQEEMLRKDMERLSDIHRRLKNKTTSQTPSGKIRYTTDANGRYEQKASLERFIDHAKKIGAFQHLLFIEEPLSEKNEEDVSDIDIPVAADDSVHSVEDAKKRIDRGYTVMVLKSIAKTLSISIKIANIAHDRGIPCVCSDLTVNPILVDWHKLLAAHLRPFPELGMSIMETNGATNYENWKMMREYHPNGYAPWTDVINGTFPLGNDFYDKNAGIFSSSKHYNDLLPNK